MSECAACSLWWRRQILWTRSLGQRLEVPAELDARVALFAEPTSRRERALAAVQALDVLTAPTQLEALVARDLEVPEVPGTLAAHDDGSRVTRALARLETRRAPDVLDRLVTEEFADPAAAAVRRHVGGLERIGAPLDLEHMAGRLTATRSRAGAGRVLRLRGHPVRASLALAAAAVIAWVAVPEGLFRDQQPAERTWSFEVVSATLTSDLGEVGFGLLDGLTGGASAVARIAEER